MGYLIVAIIAFAAGWVFRSVGAAYEDAKSARTLRAGAEQLRAASAEMKRTQVVLSAIKDRISHRNP